MENAEREEKGEDPPFLWALHLRCKCYYSTHTKERNTCSCISGTGSTLEQLKEEQERLFVFISMTQPCGAAAQDPGVFVFEGRRRRRSAWNGLSECPSERSVPLHYRSALVVSLCPSLSGLTPSKQLPSEVCGIFRNGLLSSSEFT